MNGHGLDSRAHADPAHIRATPLIPALELINDEVDAPWMFAPVRSWSYSSRSSSSVIACARRTLVRLTWAIAALTAVLVVLTLVIVGDVVLRLAED